MASVRLRNSTSRAYSSRTRWTRCFTAEPVQHPDDQRVALTPHLQCFGPAGVAERGAVPGAAGQREQKNGIRAKGKKRFKVTTDSNH